jgi:tetratricopeptide (TPR) repeat protein
VANPFIKVHSEDAAIAQIAETIKSAQPGEAPFVVVVGAGFSSGLVRTAREIVRVSIPTLDKSFIPQTFKPVLRSRGLWGAEEQRRQEEERHKEQEIYRRAALFWTKFVEENRSRGLKLELSSQGLPIPYDLAYQAAFDETYIGALGNRTEARKFQNHLIAPDILRLNAAHFFLASILAAQPHKGARQKKPAGINKKKLKKPLFKYEAAFSRLIFTTNFDPFLQVALQLADRLYFMSDTPDLVADDLVENESNAIHLVYVHGSIHRHKQRASKQDIQEVKERNAQVLASAFNKRGVIVIGYNGWDDVIVEALAKSEKFEGGLYWIDMAPRPGIHFKPRTLEILQRPGAYYIQSDAGKFMAKLNGNLVNGLPLLDNPIAQHRRKLSLINFSDLEKLEIGITEASSVGVSQIACSIVEKPTFKLAKEIALNGLKIAEDSFLKKCEETAVAHLISLARAENNCAERVKICNRTLLIESLTIPHHTSLLELRAHALTALDKIDEAIADWTQIIELKDAPKEKVWKAHFDRGCALWQKKDLVTAYKDLTQAIEQIPSDHFDLRQSCFFVRAGILFDSKKPDESIADFLSLTKDGVSHCDYSRMYDVGFSLLMNDRATEALFVYRFAAEKCPEQIESLGLKPLAGKKNVCLKSEAAKSCIDFLESFKKLNSAKMVTL